MSTPTSIVCLANSYRQGGHCVAGKEIVLHGFGAWLRPVSLRPGSELSRAECTYPDHTIPAPLDIVGLALDQPVPIQHQRENIALATHPWARLGRLSWQRVHALCDRPPTLWLNRDHTADGLHNCMAPAEAGAFDHSLLLIHVPVLTVRIASTRRAIPHTAFHGSFLYRDVPYTLRITDPSILAAFAGHDDGAYPVPDAFLCLSLSKCFHEGDGRCHKLIAAVITDPRL